MLTSFVGLHNDIACYGRIEGLRHFFACQNSSDDGVLMSASDTIFGFTFNDEIDVSMYFDNS